MQINPNALRDAILGSVEDDLAKLSNDDEMTIPLIHFRRGVIFGQLATIVAAGLISSEKMQEVIGRVDNISKLKYRDIEAARLHALRN